VSIEIKRWTDGKVIYVAEDARDVMEAVEAARAVGADLHSADLRWADLRSADLRSADLRSADLRWANLRSADLRWADLRSADLRSADLRSAELRWAKGIHPARATPLHILLDQVGKVRAYKLVTAEGYGPFNGGVHYEVGKTVECEDADTDPDSQCAAGINVATLDWCLVNWREGYRVLLVEFAARDIASIPTATDGKFRLSKCRVVREVDISEMVNPPNDERKP